MNISALEYNWMEAAEINQIERDRAINLALNSDLGQLLPFGSEVGNAVTWDKEDDIGGVLPVKVVGASYDRLDVTGATRSSVPASHYGGEEIVPADQIIARAMRGNPTKVMEISDLIAERNQVLAVKEANTIDLQRGQLLSYGIVNQYDKNENVVDTVQFDGFADRVVTLTGGDRWNQSSTAAPFDMLAGMHADYFNGTGYSAMGDAVGLMNPVTAKYLKLTAQWKAFRGPGNSQLKSIKDFNEQLSGEEGDYPVLKVIKGTAIMKSGVVPFIPDGKLIIIGRHQIRGLICGEWKVTTNENTGLPEFYTEVDRLPDAPKLPRCTRSIAGAGYLKSLKQIRVFNLW